MMCLSNRQHLHCSRSVQNVQTDYLCVYDCLCVGLSETKMYTVYYSCLFTIWSFNIAMENHHF